MHKSRLLFITLLFATRFALAQTDSLSIQQIEISSSRIPMLYSESSRIVTIISNDVIEQLPVSSINDILQMALSVDIRNRGTEGVQSDLSMSGGTSDQTLILLNGIAINNPQTGHHTLDIPIDISSIERIEILQGSSSRIYGANAFAGAINIITKNINTNHAKISFRGGENGLWSFSAMNTLAGKHSNNLFQFTKKKADGYRKNTDFNILNFTYIGKINLKKAYIDAQAGYVKKEFGANSFYTAFYPNQFEKTTSTFASLKFSSKTSNKFTCAIFWKQHTDRFELFRESPEYYTQKNGFWINGTDTAGYGNKRYYTGHNYHTTNILGIKFNYNFIWKLGKTAVGAEMRTENILSNKLGETMNDTIAVPNELNGFFNKEKQRYYSSFFIEHGFQWKRFSINGGTLFLNNNAYGNFFFPGIDANYQINKSMKIIASYNSSVRLPTFTDLYYVSATNVGNPDLLPEKATNAEAGVKYSNKTLQIFSGIFQRNGKDLIDWVRLPNETKYYANNISEVKTFGFQLYTKFTPLYKPTKTQIIKQVEINYAHTNNTRYTGQYTSLYVMDYLKHKASVNINGQIYKGLNWGLSYIYTKRNGTYMNTMKQEIEYKAYSLVNVRIMYESKVFEIYMDIDNLLDTNYLDIGNIPMPGRWIKGGIILNINL